MPRRPEPRRGPPDQTSAGFFISYAAAPRNLQQPLQRQRPLQRIFDRDPTLGHRKKLPAVKSELIPAPVGPSPAPIFLFLPLPAQARASARLSTARHRSRRRRSLLTGHPVCSSRPRLPWRHCVPQLLALFHMQRPRLHRSVTMLPPKTVSLPAGDDKRCNGYRA